MITLRYVVTALMAFAVIGLSGCATNLYQKMPQAYFHQGSGELTLTDIHSQDAAQSRCKAVAQQTTPSTSRAAWYYGSRYAIGGLVGGGLGYAAAAKIVGTAIGGAALGAAGAYYGIASGVVGAFAGPINNDIIKRNTDVWCRALDSYGIKMYPPSVVKEVRKGKHSDSASATIKRTHRVPPPPLVVR